MLRAYLVAFVLVSIGGSLLVAQGEDKLTSGPKPGTFMPGPFECYNINGAASGRQHCLVCKFALSPAVLIFAREQPEEKDAVLDDLLGKLDAAVTEFRDREFYAGVVFLSPDARDSTNNATEDDAKKIIEEATKREQLQKRLRPRAFGFDVSEKGKEVTVTRVVAKTPAAEAGLKEGDRLLEARRQRKDQETEEPKYETIGAMADMFRLAGTIGVGRTFSVKVDRDSKPEVLSMRLKNLIVGYYLPEGPKAYALNEKADVTVIFYERLKVKESWAFGAGGLQEKDVETIIKHVRDALPLKKKI